MSDYRAPIDEMMFMLKHIAQVERLNQISGLEDYSLELAKSVLEEAAKFASGVLAPLNWVGDQQGAAFSDGRVSTPEGWKTAYQQFCDDGWLSLALDEQFYGQGLPKYVAMPVNEMWQSANLAFVMFQPLTQGGSEIFYKLANEQQQQTYLEKIATGEWSVAMALTEPNAGSDLAALSAKAIPINDGRYKIKGQKIFITYGEHDFTDNIVHLVLARIEGAPQGNKGISLFIVPKLRFDAQGNATEANDVQCISIEHKLGLHGSPTCTMVYGENDDCYGELIGTENRGLEAMFILMNEARLSTGLQGVALGEIALQKAQAYALERMQGREIISGQASAPIADHPDVKRMLLTVRSQVTALRALSVRVAADIDEAEAIDDEVAKTALQARIALLTPIFKAHATEVGNQLTAMAIQIYGGMGFMEETGIAQHLRDARITTIYEGTTGIQAKDLLFRKIQLDNAKAINNLFDDIQNSAEQLLPSQYSESIANPLVSALAKLRIMANAVTDKNTEPYRLFSGAVPFLEAMGVLCGGWQMAVLVQAALHDSEQDKTFKENLFALAEFYSAHVLTKINALEATFQTAEQGVKNYRIQS